MNLEIILTRNYATQSWTLMVLLVCTQDSESLRRAYLRWQIGMATRVGWDLELLQKKDEPGGSVKVTKKTTGANGEAEKDFKGVIGRVEGTSKYGKLHYRVTHHHHHHNHHHIFIKRPKHGSLITQWGRLEQCGFDHKIFKTRFPLKKTQDDCKWLCWAARWSTSYTSPWCQPRPLSGAEGDGPWWLQWSLCHRSSSKFPSLNSEVDWRRSTSKQQTSDIERLFLKNNMSKEMKERQNLKYLFPRRCLWKLPVYIAREIWVPDEVSWIFTLEGRKTISL